MKQEKVRVLWAVDPFAEDLGLQCSAVRAIQAFVRDRAAVIEPVYLHSLFAFPRPLAGSSRVPAPLVQQLRADGQRALDQILGSTGIPGIRPLRVLSASHIDLKQGVQKITDLAHRWDADLVVSTTRARSGLNRLMIGSFAETLLLYSNAPLLFVNPRWKKSVGFSKILFPTDFSKESQQAFKRVLRVASSMRAKITLFHQAEFPRNRNVSLSSGVYAIYKEAFDRELSNRRKEADVWVNEAKAAGVRVTIRIDRRSGRYPSEAIVSEAKKGYGMIAIASHSGPIQTTFLGSTTRIVVRTSPCPVWVVHPQPSRSAATLKLVPPTIREPLFTVSETDILGDLDRIPVSLSKRSPARPA